VDTKHTGANNNVHHRGGVGAPQGGPGGKPERTDVKPIGPKGGLPGSTVKVPPPPLTARNAVAPSAPPPEEPVAQAAPVTPAIVRLEAIVGEGFRFADFVANLAELEPAAREASKNTREIELGAALTQALLNPRDQALTQAEVHSIVQGCRRQLKKINSPDNAPLQMARDVYRSAIRQAAQHYNASLKPAARTKPAGPGARDDKHQAVAAPRRDLISARAPSGAELLAMPQDKRIGVLAAILSEARDEETVAARWEQVEIIKGIRKTFPDEAAAILSKVYTPDELAALLAAPS